MSYKYKTWLKDEAKEMMQKIIGKKIVSAEVPLSPTGFYSHVTVVLEDGMKLEVHSGTGGCDECDPEGFGIGVIVNVREDEVKL